MKNIQEILALNLPAFNAAYAIASEAHKDQRRKDGKHYMTHIEAVVENVYDDLSTSYFIDKNVIENILCVAALHDGPEDHPDTCSLETIFEKLLEIIPQERISDVYQIKFAISAITKKPKGAERYDEYVLRVKNNEWARITKLADLKHNLSDLNEGNMKQKYELTKWVLEN